MALFNKPKTAAEEPASKNEPLKLGQALNFAASEAYNLLRTNLTFLFPDTNGKGKVIGITSTCPKEGKSFTAVNLAYTFAADGNKVLLIDGDMRCPTLYIKLGIPSAPGLSNMLIGADISPVSGSSLHENLSVLVSGDIPPNPAALIGSERMNLLLRKFAEQYDFVILDLPPVNEVSDPVSVSKFLDGVLLVLGHGRSKRRDVLETVRRLKFVNAKLLGFVYNSYSNSRGRHKRSYGYGYGGYGGYGNYGSNYGYGYGNSSGKSEGKGEKTKEIPDAANEVEDKAPRDVAIEMLNDIESKINKKNK